MPDYRHKNYRFYRDLTVVPTSSV